MCRFNRVTLAIVVVAAMMTACEKKGGEEVRPGAATPAPGDAALIEAKLAKADAFDGKVDKIVTKCLGCGLGMDGSKEFAATTAGYTLHLCSAHCKTEFEKDPNKAVMALRIPGE
ncbi:MAG TPA: hypothetical protein VJZ71_13340 [Phycisphaerae bacterium]|nr:hypothetical protein [Phycisphaerae bacterium]